MPFAPVKHRNSQRILSRRSARDGVSGLAGLGLLQSDFAWGLTPFCWLRGWGGRGRLLGMMDEAVFFSRVDEDVFGRDGLDSWALELEASACWATFGRGAAGGDRGGRVSGCGWRSRFLDPYRSKRGSSDRFDVTGGRCGVSQRALG